MSYAICRKRKHLEPVNKVIMELDISTIDPPARSPCLCTTMSHKKKY